MIFFAISTVTLIGCSDDDDPSTTDNSISYNLNERSSSGISGDIEFLELSDGRIQAQISLVGTSDGTSHPAHVHMNSAAMGGSIIISLDPVDGATGSSVTIFGQSDGGANISLADIKDLDAYVNVHKSSSELDVIISQGDIGSNILTGDSKTYELEERAVDGISGEVSFSKRKNGNTLAIIDLDGTPAGGLHPAHIHMNSAAESGGIIISFNPVVGESGISMTDIRNSDDGTPFDYENILTANAYVNVHLSATELGTIVAQGDIGLNELTGSELEYTLEEKDIVGISGKVNFAERMDGSVLATLSLTGTPSTGVHPAHIHKNSASEGGDIAVTFTSVDGSTGQSLTSIRTADDGTPFNFQLISSYDGYINVHKSVDELNVIVAQGNIGINN